MTTTRCLSWWRCCTVTQLPGLTPSFSPGVATSLCEGGGGGVCSAWRGECVSAGGHDKQHHRCAIPSLSATVEAHQLPANRRTDCVSTERVRVLTEPVGCRSERRQSVPDGWRVHCGRASLPVHPLPHRRGCQRGHGGGGALSLGPHTAAATQESVPAGLTREVERPCPSNSPGWRANSTRLGAGG
jgi:hypothetical protein